MAHLIDTAVLLLCINTVLGSSSLLRRTCINEDCTAIRVAINNPPINLWDVNVIHQLNTFLHGLSNDNHTKIVVVSSAVPGFFGAQIDLNLITPNIPQGVNVTEVFDQYYENLGLIQQLPFIFIAEVDGRAWGAGDEHLLRMDMRFAGPDAQFGAPEAAVGLIHVGGTQQLVRLISPGLTSEYMLSAAQVNATEAARIGWVNSAYPTAAALRQHVDRLASRIALFHIEVIRATKTSIARQAPSAQMFQSDLKLFNDLAAEPFLIANVKTILELSKNQSIYWEYNNNDNIARSIYQS